MTDSDWEPGPKYQQLLDEIDDVLSTGEHRTVREVYYALEARGHGWKGESWEYRQVKRALTKGRRTGRVDPALICADSSRDPIATPTLSTPFTPDTFLERELDGLERRYRVNPWDEQPKYVEVWLEKAALSSLFQPICTRQNVRLEATRGDWSESKKHAAAERLAGRIDRGRDVRILYFGDYNPSGFHAPVAIQNTMQYYGLDLGRAEADSGERDHFEIWPFESALEFPDGGSIRFERVALNPEHVDEFDLPENPCPSSGSKGTILDGFKAHVTDGDDTNIELNALKEFEREYLEDLITDSITAHIDRDRWRASESEYYDERDEIRERINALTAADDGERA